MSQFTILPLLTASGVAALLLASCQFGPEPFDLQSAQPVAPVSKKPTTTATRDPRKLEPDTAKFDWIRLKSDEWLKGEILSLRDGKFEFDSDELDKLKLDWADVAEVRTSKMHTVLLEDLKTHTGKIQVDAGRLLFQTDPVRFVDRSRLMAIVPGESGEANRWSGEVSLGVTLRGGNTEQTDMSFYAFARRETAATRWDTSYNQNLSEASNVETANSHRVESKFDVFLTKRLYVTLLGVTYYRDRFQNIDHRITPNVGLGYDVVDSKNVDWEVTVAPAYQSTRYVSVLPTEDQTDETAAIVLGTMFEWDITKDVEFDFEYQIIAPLPDTDEYSHHLMTKMSIDLTGNLDLDVSFIWDRNNAQIPNSSGITPDADDYRTVIGFALDF